MVVLRKIIGYKYIGKKIILIHFALAVFLASTILPASEGIQKNNPVKRILSERREIPDDEYIFIPHEGRQTAPAYRFFKSGFFTVQVNINSSGYNIIGDAANEPSIAVDPTDPNRIVIGWRQFDTISSNFR